MTKIRCKMIKGGVRILSTIVEGYSRIPNTVQASSWHLPFADFIRIFNVALP
jgi:hypothetical protein